MYLRRIGQQVAHLGKKGLSACYSFVCREPQRPNRRCSSKLWSAAPVPQRGGGSWNSATSFSGSSAEKLKPATWISSSRGTCLRCAGPPPSMRGRSNAEKHRAMSQSGSAVKTAWANFHQFCTRAKQVVATLSDTPLTSPIVLVFAGAGVQQKRLLCISCSIVVVWPG